jgi:methylaspartate mutase epsilon subunit
MTFEALGLRPSADLPDLADVLAYLRRLGKPSAAEVLATAAGTGRPAIQPRCGVGSHAAMRTLLTEAERRARPDLLTLTIDSYTRLRRFPEAARVLAADPGRLNGYPLVAHGWRRGRELNEAVRVPLQIRHGSPDPRELFATALAAGITSFEGGGVSYNLPYAKDVPLRESLAAWRLVDRACGLLAARGVVVEREMFGTLTAVLLPPSVSIAVSLLEALSAAREGVRCVSLAYPQGGNAVQDVAALRAIGDLTRQYLPAGTLAYPVLHQFMGPFPREPERADALILLGGLVAVWGGAAKVIVKTNQEAAGIPDLDATVRGLRTTQVAASGYLGAFGVDESAVAEEREWICREVRELVDPVVAGAGLAGSIEAAFRDGRLDVPFSASIHAHSAVIPCRDRFGAVRYGEPGRLPLSAATLRRNNALCDQAPARPASFVDRARRDIEYFSAQAR